MSPLNREKIQNLRRVFGHDLQFRQEVLDDGRVAIVVANCFRRPKEVHRKPPELPPALLNYVADALNARAVTVTHGMETDEIWGMIIEDLPTLIITPEK